MGRTKRTKPSGGLPYVPLAGLVVLAALGVYFTRAPSNPAPPVEEVVGTVQETVSDTCDDLSDWLSRTGPVLGFHVLCVASGGQTLTLYARGQDTDDTTHNLTRPEGVAWPDVSEAVLRPMLERVVEVAPSHRDDSIRAAHARKDFAPQGWRLFAPSGVPVDTVPGDGILLLFEGGQWLWPAVELGFRRTVYVHDRKVDIVTVSLKPLVLSVEHFLADTECDYLINTAGKHMRKSDVSLMDKDKGRAATDFRTSDTWFMPSREERVKLIDRRVANLTRTRVNQQENVQVLRYVEHQRYSQHLDWFAYESYQNDRNMVDMIKGGYRNRMATVFWYMNDPPEGSDGGETNFGLAQHGDYLDTLAANPKGRGPNGDCRTGFSVRPQKGKVIIFYSLLPDGTGDPMSQHSACPPEGKTALKWAANKWVWNEPMTYTRDDLDAHSHAPAMKDLH